MKCLQPIMVSPFAAWESTHDRCEGGSLGAADVLCARLWNLSVEGPVVIVRMSEVEPVFEISTERGLALLKVLTTDVDVVASFKVQDCCAESLSHVPDDVNWAKTWVSCDCVNE